MDLNFIKDYVIRFENSSVIIMEILHVACKRNEISRWNNSYNIPFITKFLDFPSLIYGSVTEVITFCFRLQFSLSYNRSLLKFIHQDHSHSPKKYFWFSKSALNNEID